MAQVLNFPSLPANNPSNDWQRDLITYPNTTTPKRIGQNVFHVLTHAQEWRNVVWFDDFRQAISMGAPIPGSSRPFKPGQQWTDTDSIEAMFWMQRNGLDMFRANIEEGILLAAKYYHRHPLIEYLCALEWDQTPRLEYWLQDHMGGEDTPLLRAIGRCWMVSAVARVFEPGCQADHCLILEGRQGLKKSTALRTLAGSEYFAEHNADSLTSKDAAIHCNGVWIMEFSELGSVRHAAKEIVKAFVTRRHDHYRPPYGKHAITVPRSNVFAGTTNESTYLVDDTGNRRYWPVKCTRANVDGIAEMRDQLWAEAVALYNRSEPWHLPYRLEQAAVLEQAQRLETNPWLEAMQEYAKGRKAVNVNEFLRKHLAMELSQIGQREMNKAAHCLKSMGWTSVKTNGPRLWIPPNHPIRKHSLLG